MAEPYDVFISHCGKDSKRDFAVWLKNELELAGVRCFLDERDLKLGDPAADTMLKAMAEAKYGVVILSKGFFERECCVKELENFLGRKNVLPVFLGIAPGELSGVLESVRGQRVWEGFELFSWTEEEYFGIVEQAGAYTGLRLEAVDGFWDACIRRLKSELLFLLNKLDGGVKLSGSGPLFGIEEHLVPVKQLLGVRHVPLGTEQDEGPVSERVGEKEGESSGEVSEIQAESSGLPRVGGGDSGAWEVGIVGVKGMGGVGKTTLAKRLYDDADVRSFFGGRVCWLEVNEKPGPEKVCRLQEEVIRDLCQVGVRFSSPTKGRAEIRAKLRGGQPVLICLDDIWDDGDPAVVVADDLPPGSRILKTTRDKRTIEPTAFQFDLDVLDPPDAERLFLWHAFGGATPSDRFAAFVEPTVAFCGGLPLAVEVLGSLVAAMLASNDGVRRWTDLVADLQDGQAKETREGRLVHNVLMRSYDSLPDHCHKDAFVLVAGLWPDEPLFRKERMVVAYLGASVYGDLDVDIQQRRARGVLSELSFRSLLKLESSDDNTEKLGNFRVTVHDLLVDVARSVIDGSRSNLGATKKRFCRWVGKAGEEPPSDHRTEHLMVDPLTSANFPHALFSCNPRIVSFVATISQTLTLPDLAPGLRYCRLLVIKAKVLYHNWSLSGLEDLPDLQVVDLDTGTETGLETLEKRGGLRSFPTSLRSLSHVRLVNQRVLRTLNLPQGLLELSLKSCDSLTSLHCGSFVKLQRLKIVGCPLASFPTNHFKCSSELTHVELSIPGLSTPEHILDSLMYTGIPRYRGWGDWGLETGDRVWGWRLFAGPRNEHSLCENDSRDQKMLRHLELDGCIDLLPSFSLGPSLTCLRLFDRPFLDASPLLADFAINLRSLTSLQLREVNLRALPASVESLRNLSKLELDDCSSLESLPNEVSSLIKLSSLSLSGCRALRNLPDSIGSLKSLKLLSMSDCVSLQGLPPSMEWLQSLEILDLRFCESLKELPSSANLEMREFFLGGCGKLKRLPATIGKLSSLDTLELLDCSKLTHLPESLGELVSLRNLDLRSCSLLEELPSSVGGLISLEILNVQLCSKLAALPGSIGSLQKLEQLYLQHCASLDKLPSTVSCLTSLRILDLSYCSGLREWPSSLTRLTNLQHLEVSGISDPAFSYASTTMPWLVSRDRTFRGRHPAIPEVSGFVLGIRVFQPPTIGEHLLHQEWGHPWSYSRRLLSDEIGVSGREAPALKGRILHPARCKNCDMDPLEGTRYKSIDKEDFDLCQSCFDLSKEKDESFHRIEYPIFRPEFWPSLEALLKETRELEWEAVWREALEREHKEVASDADTQFKTPSEEGSVDEELGFLLGPELLQEFCDAI